MLKFPTLWEEYSPDTLLDICVKYCIKNPQTFCTYNPVHNEYLLREGVTLPAEICERMLKLSVEDLDRVIDDSFLRIFIDNSATRLKQVNLQGTSVSDDGIEIICRHNILELNISQCVKLTERTLMLLNNMSSELLSLVIGNSVQILPDSLTDTEVNMSGNQFVKSKSIYQEQNYILNAPSLRRLVVHGLEIPMEKDYFPLLLKPLQLLIHLDLSSCRQLGDLYYLVSHRHLASLVLYNVPHLQDAITSICQIKTLRHLDVSQCNEKRGHYKYPNQTLRQIVESLPHLTSLDISGTNLAGSGVQERESPQKESSPATEDPVEVPLTDIPGLKSRVNCPLEFLGLFNTAHEACYRHHIPSKRIAGDANEEQILTAAQVYYDRPEILQKVLNDLFHVFRYDSCNNSRLALDVVMVAMKQHLTEKHIQIAGSASLFYIVKGEEKNNFNIKIKRRIIKALLDAMCAHRDDTTMLRNGCLTLIHFKIPQDVLFDYERLVDILLHIVSQEDQDDFVQRIGIYLLNSVACQVDGIQKQLVGDRGAITIMLRLIENRLNRHNCDEVMETAWSTMWNVTDETPINCQRFLDGRGMDLFLGCLQSFSDKPELLRNMMGLLGNVAEVKDLRPRLMKDEYLSVFSELLDSTSDGIEVSYNAAGILSHIMSDGPEPWISYNIRAVQRPDVLWRMVKAIERWKLNTKRNINYRSFEPILRLLNVDHSPEAQHWAVWALANLTRVYADKYCSLLKEEGGLQMLEDLLLRPKPYARIKELAQITIDQCERYEKFGKLDDLPENQG
ncbi:protein zer-1 homolog [Centruroides sculpturatus]|uniref:protein zer-1 homolog n=1 Tax=Centruroides sculpturatus TaxID=218467 RepID=UPI000C6DA212|nr:protein zer-1 homolog [Centruroides sculpturatus]